MERYKKYTHTKEAPGGFMERGELKRKVAGKMKGDKYKKEIDNKKPFAKKDSERFEENGGMSGEKANKYPNHLGKKGARWQLDNELK